MGWGKKPTRILDSRVFATRLKFIPSPCKALRQPFSFNLLQILGEPEESCESPSRPKQGTVTGATNSGGSRSRRASLPPLLGSPGCGIENEDAGGAGDGAPGLLGDVDAVRELREGRERARGSRYPSAHSSALGPSARPEQLTASLMILVMTALGRFRSSGLSAMASAGARAASAPGLLFRQFWRPDFPRR